MGVETASISPKPRLGLLASRTVQVHPTLRCNLSCRHCYSNAGPARSEVLAADDLLFRLKWLRQEGYDVLSFSGGEPLLYPHLGEVASGAHALGYRVNMTTNGTLLSSARLAPLVKSVSMIGVSVDGAPARHDDMRGASGRLDRVCRGISVLRELKVPFGLSHCFTRDSIQDLPWLAAFAIDQGAALLQFHPLTQTGRAQVDCNELALTQADLERVCLIVELLRIEHHPLTIQLDLADARRIGELQKNVVRMAGDAPLSLLSDFVNPAVLDVSGQLWPFTYGLHQSQCLAPADRDDWSAAILRAKARGIPRLQELVAATCSSIDDDGLSIVDWYGRLVATSFSERSSVLPRYEDHDVSVAGALR